jgi:hypothetical protein
MQTFLPYPDFVSSVKALDYRRLGKQRVEAMQLVNSTNKLAANPSAKVGWANHPARTMWRGYLPALKLYHNVCIQEWIDRGYNNTMKYYNLLRKDPSYYSVHGWTEPDNIEYFWPVEL